MDGIHPDKRLVFDNLSARKAEEYRRELGELLWRFYDDASSATDDNDAKRIHFECVERIAELQRQVEGGDVK